MTDRQANLAIAEKLSIVSKMEILEQKARSYAKASRAPARITAYASDWADFKRWCVEQGLDHLPAQPRTVALYLTDRSDVLKVSTLARRVIAIRHVHSRFGRPLDALDPQISGVMDGLRRVKGVAVTKKKPLRLRELDLILRRMPADLLGHRNAAMLLVGFAGALRRSEVVGIDVEHLDWNDDFLVIRIPRSKTDQVGAGRSVTVPFGSHPGRCPIRNLRRWLKASGISTGPVFRPIAHTGREFEPRRLSDRQVSAVVKFWIGQLGFNEADYGGHSLRSGFCTEASARGATLSEISEQSGHQSADQVLGYIRSGAPLEGNAVTRLGL